ncbi:MAG TPA: hypothetical protein VFB60_23290 [Ktedonobacteraceae bacterium]|nr:hypothetical protein [Ktedonobacteraceae bacterium]
MGVERSVTRWYIQRDIILKEIELLETKLADAPADNQRSSSEKAAADVPLQLAGAREKLVTLGPCPKPMMG